MDGQKGAFYKPVKAWKQTSFFLSPWTKKVVVHPLVQTHASLPKHSRVAKINVADQQWELCISVREELIPTLSDLSHHYLIL
jgi:hypothetical protein